MGDQEKIKLLAYFEIEWWKAHHRRKRKELIENMTQLYVLLFNLDYEQARRAVLLRVEATTWHDQAEEYEDKGGRDQAEIYWDKAEECLRQHFEILDGMKK